LCPASDSCHDVGVCDPSNGTCSNSAKFDGSSCDDGNACTQSDSCKAGVCIGSNLKSCPAPDSCHDVGVCDPSTGSCYNSKLLDGAICSNGSCQNGICIKENSGENSHQNKSGGCSSSSNDHLYPEIVVLLMALFIRNNRYTVK
jgi:hypothetical protein